MSNLKLASDQFSIIVMKLKC